MSHSMRDDIIECPWIAYNGDLRDLPTASLMAFIAHLSDILLERANYDPLAVKAPQNEEKRPLEGQG